MKRVIRDYESLAPELRSLLEEAFPHGVRREDLISFPASGGKRIYGVELHTEDTTYIIRGNFDKPRERFGFSLLDEREMQSLADEEDGI